MAEYITKQKKTLLDFLSLHSERSFTVEELTEGIRLKSNDGRAVGKSTVYRLIAKLVDDGILRRISDGKTRKVTYQYIGGGSCSEHLHLKCKDCGILIHLDDVTSHILEKRIYNTEGFTLDGGALIYGRCEACSDSRGGGK